MIRQGVQQVENPRMSTNSTPLSHPDTQPQPTAVPDPHLGGVITVGPADKSHASPPPPAEVVAEKAVVEHAAPPPEQPKETPRATPSSILVIDIGGTKVKLLATGQTEPTKASSGKSFTPAKLIDTVRSLTHNWEYEAISIGIPSPVGPHGPRSEPGNLGRGWVGFDFAAAFNKPVKIINDAAMQALGSYDGGRMLFLGLGTGLGSALIAGNLILPLELGRIPYDKERTLGEVLGRAGLNELGKGEWREAVNRWAMALMGAFAADYVVVGGGNASKVKELPPGGRLGHNLAAFRGGIRLWNVGDAWVVAMAGGDPSQTPTQEALRLL